MTKEGNIRTEKLESRLQMMEITAETSIKAMMAKIFHSIQFISSIEMMVLTFLCKSNCLLEEL